MIGWYCPRYRAAHAGISSTGTCTKLPDGYFADDDGFVEMGSCLPVWSWDDDDANCALTQYGCPSTACDGDDAGAWCMIDDTQWCYCE